MISVRGVFFILSALVMAEAAVAGDQSGQAGTGSPAAAAPQDASAMVRANSLPPEPKHEGKLSQFSLTGLDGARHSLADWKGKVVVLNFWATWCSPCLYEIRDFVAYQKQYKRRGLQVIGLGLDEERKLRNVQRTLEINYPVLVADPAENGDLMKLWGNSSGVLPYTVVLDRDGRVAYVYRGQMNREVFDEYVLPLLDKA